MASWELDLHGQGCYPKINFTSIIYFKPTCVGSLAKREFVVKNYSKIWVSFNWEIPDVYASMVSISPKSGVIAPSGNITLLCSFCPQVASRFNLSIPCYYHELNDILLDFEKKKLTLTVEGTAIRGILVAEPSVLDFEKVLINTVTEKIIILFNPSACDICYKLDLSASPYIGSVQLEDSLKRTTIFKNVEYELEIIQSSGIIPARSNGRIKIQALFRMELDYSFDIFYTLETHEMKKLPESEPSLLQLLTPERRLLCKVVGSGVHPLIVVADIRTEFLSNRIIRKMFSVDELNLSLSKANNDASAYAENIIESDDFPADEIEMVSTKADDAEVYFDFGATLVREMATVVYMALRNDGVVAIDWSFQIINEFLDTESWARPTEPTVEQRMQSFILDQNIFTIFPIAGNLQPGGSTRISLSYSHEHAGLHKVPLMLRLKNGASKSGKEIFIRMQGYSIVQPERYLHLDSSTHQFDPVYIGSKNVPIQTYLLMNRGSEQLEYSFDQENVRSLCQKHGGFEIFQCLDQEGIIPVGDQAYLQFIFHPLEAIRYEVKPS